MKRKGEKGALVVEAAIVLTVVTMFISLMLYLAMIFYQQSLVTIIANQTASNIAQTYGNTLKDSFTGYIDADSVYETVTYTNMRNEAYLNVMKQKANAATLYRLKSSQILTTGDTSVEVEIVNKDNELLKSQVVVTIEDTYEIPLVSFFGPEGLLTFKATGRADCVDLLEYLSGVPAVGTTDGNPVVFSDDECTVNFYAHYGDDRPLRTVTVLRGYSVNGSRERTYSQMPSKPTEANMRFVGWRTEDKRNFTGETIVNNNLNVYGCWECTVTLNPDGGNVSPTTLIATVGETVDLPEATRDNCNFAGWFTEKNGEGQQYYNSTIIEGDITLYAKWVCVVTFNSDGGSVTLDSKEVIYGMQLGNCPTPTRNGCTFAGWYTKKYGEGTKYQNSEVIKGHTVVYAKWTCTVYLNPEGGYGVPGSLPAIVGKTVSLSSPQRAHNTFVGWFTEKDGHGTKYTSEKLITGSVTLYADWNCNHEYNRWQSKAATCTQRQEWTYECKYCGHSYKEYGNKGECKYAANCGVRHERTPAEWSISDYHFNEAHWVYWGGCSVCIYCHASSWAVLCGTHFEKYGGFAGWSSYRQVIPIHGYRTLY